MSDKDVLYNNVLGNEWINWVEEADPTGSREQEIYPLIKDWLAKIKSKEVLDIGCGQGACVALIDRGIKYIGIDPAPILIERAKKLYSSEGREFVEGDAYKIPLGKASVDASMSIWVWSHLENLELAAEEMERVLKSEGHFLIITANPDTYEERKTFYKSYEEKDGLLVGTFDLGEGKTLTDSTLYLHTREKIEEAIKRAGLIIDSIDEIGQTDTYKKGLYLAIQGHKL